MEWIESLDRAINYIEDNLTEEISVDDVAGAVYASPSHFQFIFHVVTGSTISEYIRNRRLTLAAYELLKPESRIIDVAMKYQYDTQESFSKAFLRFHGVPPSKIRADNIKTYLPLTINVIIRGGFDMKRAFAEEFKLMDIEGMNKLAGAELYNKIVNWALDARRHNPTVFDELTEWISTDSEWTRNMLPENEQILRRVFSRFKEQNELLRKYLMELQPSGIVNSAVFAALDRFDFGLKGFLFDKAVQEAAQSVLADFTSMLYKPVRALISGGKTGPAGTDTVPTFGFINYLKECDAQVQWALFMPEYVKKQQNGFKVESFEYKRLGEMRFIGKEGEELADVAKRREVFERLDDIGQAISEMPYDLLFMHHNGGGVDVSEWHGVWGRFMKAGTPVPEGYQSFDFVLADDMKAGNPFISQMAYCVFSGDIKAMHSCEGYDSDAMYDVTRNIILGQGVNIPYPSKYWTAEVFTDGCDKDSTAYLFSVKM